MSNLQLTPTIVSRPSIIFTKSSASPSVQGVTFQNLDFEFDRTMESGTNSCIFEDLPIHSPFPLIPRRLTWSKAMASTPLDNPNKGTTPRLSGCFRSTRYDSLNGMENDQESGSESDNGNELNFENLGMMDMKHENDQLRSENRKLKEKNKDIQKRLDEADDQNGVFKDRIQHLESRLHRLQEIGDKEKNKYEKHLGDADENLDKARSRITELGTKLVRMEKKYYELTKIKDELESELDKSQAEIVKLTRDLQKSKHSYRSAQERGIQMKGEIEDLLSKVEDVRSLNTKLELEKMELLEIERIKYSAGQQIDDFEIEDANEIEIDLGLPSKSIFEELSQFIPLTNDAAMQTENLPEPTYEFLDINPSEEQNNNISSPKAASKNVAACVLEQESSFSQNEVNDISDMNEDSKAHCAVMSPFISNPPSSKKKSRKWWSFRYGITLVLILIQIFGALYWANLLDLDSSSPTFLLSHSHSDYGSGQESPSTFDDTSFIRLVKFISKYGELNHEQPPRF